MLPSLKEHREGLATLYIKNGRKGEITNILSSSASMIDIVNSLTSFASTHTINESIIGME
jgi:hypothetical protein